MERVRRALMHLGLFTIATLINCGLAAAQDGVTVHGHWSVEVRNPDGSLAARHEFQNALSTGAQVLAPLLNRDFTITGWEIHLLNAASGPCRLADLVTPVECRIVDPTAIVPPQFQGSWFPTLALSVPTNQGQSAYTGTLELTGNFTAQVADAIESVATAIAGTTTAFGPEVVGFSGRTLATPIQVAAGQRVYFKVVFSFS